ncbi:FtsX-like permease family protein [Flexivirga caeni]|uniref:FtsX-like permease family protein n=1 Tax=Flexivirga caeni TaxID=2294115 RepID=A0A3M9LXP4_9MICO|nr:FtsX-like permease family protein [Flexivirga caeni]RNI18081.1 FtsX-like permease family protein [Flexivirga caeni]
MWRLAGFSRRSRRAQSVLFAVAVGLLVAVVAVDPLLTRSFRFALVRFHVASLDVSSQQVQLLTAGGEPQVAAHLERAVDPRVRAVTGPPAVLRLVQVTWPQRSIGATLLGTADGCAHVHLVAGRCPTARNEVILPEGQVEALMRPKLRLGAELTVKGADYDFLSPDLTPQKKLKFVGVYTAPDNARFWGGLSVGSYSQTTPTYWLTAPATFHGHPPTSTVPQGDMTSPDVSWSGISTALYYQLAPHRITPSTLAHAVAGMHASEMRLGSGVSVTEALSSVYAETNTDVRQAGQILPFLLLQLGAVLLILLAQVTSYLATVRRSEAAVLKMRGNGAAGVLQLGARELLPAGVAGLLGGVALAYAVDQLVRVWWLPGHVGPAWLWSTLVAAGATGLVLAGMWWIIWWSMAHEPISALLRERPSRRRGVWLSAPTAALGAACLAGVVLTATKSLTGAPAQLTPVLLAGLVAIMIGALLAPVAARLVTRLLRRRRPAGALAIAQLGRRAGIVTALGTLIITSALLTLSVSVFARGADNRAARSAADLGANAVLHVTAGVVTVHPGDLIAAIDAVDPHHRYFTPAVQIYSSTSFGSTVLGVIPADMQRLGSRIGVSQPVPWSKLEGHQDPSEPAALAATWTTNAAVGSTVTAPTMGDVNGPFRITGTAPYIPGAGATTIVANLAVMNQAGDRVDRLSYQVFSATQNPRLLHRLDVALLRAGFASTTTQTMDQARAGYAATATAWAMDLSIVVCALSVLAALVSVMLVAVASRADRARDLRALRTGGLSARVLRRATIGEFLLLSLAGGVVGSVTAPLAAWLTGRAMLWWSTPPAQPVTRTGFQWPFGTSAAAGLIVLLLLAATVFGTWIVRSAELSESGRST